MRCVAALAFSVLALAGCGSGRASTPSVLTEPPAPGASIDPNAGGPIAGPANQAKRVASQQEARDRQLEQPGGANP